MSEIVKLNVISLKTCISWGINTIKSDLEKLRFEKWKPKWKNVAWILGKPAESAKISQIICPSIVQVFFGEFEVPRAFQKYPCCPQTESHLYYVTTFRTWVTKVLRILFFWGKIKGWTICTWRFVSSGGRLDGEQTETASERRAPWATSTLKAGIGQNWSQLAVRWLVRPLKDDPKDEPKETNETMQRPEGGQAGNPAETCSGGSDCQSAVSGVLFWAKNTIWAS